VGEGEKKSGHRVLALDGGGIRGLFSATILYDMITYFDVKPFEQFDMIVGNSIGGILALPMAQHVSITPNDLFNQENIDTIFDKSLWDKMVGVYQVKPKYGGAGKTSVLEKYMADRNFGSCCVPTVLISYDMTKNEPRVFCSWDHDDAKLSCVSVADATSAAPLYFPPVVIGNSIYADGALASNNPAMVTYTMATEMWPQDQDLRILSIGTGVPKLRSVEVSPLVDEFWGLPKWISHGLLDIMFNGPNQITTDLVQKLLPGKRFLRLDSTKIGNIALDDTSANTRQDLINEAHSVVQGKASLIRDFFS